MKLRIKVVDDITGDVLQVSDTEVANMDEASDLVDHTLVEDHQSIRLDFHRAGEEPTEEKMGLFERLFG